MFFISSKKSKNKNFKLAVKGEISLDILNNFVNLDVTRDRMLYD